MSASRASDQWLKSEGVSLEASGAYFGLATVDIGSSTGALLTKSSGVTTYVGSTGDLLTKTSGATVYPGGDFLTKSSGVTIYHGDTVGLKAGAAWVGLATVNSVGYAWTNYTSNTTGTLKTGVGMLGAVTFLSASCPTISLWDSTLPSGTKIASFPAGLAAGQYGFNAALTNGLAIEGTAGVAPQVILTYR